MRHLHGQQEPFQHKAKKHKPLLVPASNLESQIDLTCMSLEYETRGPTQTRGKEFRTERSQF